MMTTKISAASDRYLQLIREFPLRPLRSKADLERATVMLDALSDPDKLAAGDAPH